MVTQAFKEKSPPKSIFKMSTLASASLFVILQMRMVLMGFLNAHALNKIIRNNQLK